MKTEHINNMKAGYFMGDFEPNIFRTDKVEMAMKEFPKGTLDSGYYRKKDVEVVVVLSGQIEVNGRKYDKGSMVRFDPYEMINIFAVTDSSLMIIRTPGTKNDIYRYADIPFEDLEQQLQKAMAALEQQGGELLRYKTDKIDDKELTVVVQGYADLQSTGPTIRSIRKHMPNAHIILSTWKDCEVAGLDVDELILNEDPGCYRCNIRPEHQITNNGNRQLLSTQRGLEKVKRPYVLKLRTDLMLLGDDILYYMNSFPKRDDNYPLFDQRVIIGELFTRRNFHFHANGQWNCVPKPFHPSDWFLLGRTQDVQSYFLDTPLMPEGDLTGYVFKHPERAAENNYPWSWRYATEQYFCYSAFQRKFKNIEFADWTDWDDYKIAESEKMMLNNFTILNLLQHKIVNTKYVNVCFTSNGIHNHEKDLLSNEIFLDYYNKL